MECNQKPLKRLNPRKKRKSKGIVAWPEGERPRERLLRLGAHSLTDAELVAILLRIGVEGTSAVEMARQILKRFGSLRAVSGIARREICQTGHEK